ncbi:hypothetical protein RS399_21655 [Bacillus inaquosorum]|uniref:hypothetical protein n=1 Tax=Bacillus inaquosorum TaxID=483913 RepID=UPI000A114AD7|nr:hypothetical protein [Bacillus inaquosorum]ARV43895.1 hypothetical protein BCV50_02275 [Bacillus subtilis]QJC88928.1 hypothetical protein HC662_20930 [Bacillus subtilis]WNW24248.1 hypothetical protein RS399_21655 [Bacillus inaquosorum]
MIKKIRITTNTREEMKEFIRSNSIDINCGGPSQQTDGTFVVEAYVPENYVDEVQTLGCSFEVAENISRSMLEQRQQEVGIGDRYENGRIAPQGLGIKR